MHPMVNYNTFYMILLSPLYLYNSNYLIFLTQNRSCSTIYPALFIACLLPTHAAFVIYSTHFSTLYTMVHSCSDKINLSVDIINCAFTSLLAVITKQSPVDFNLLLRQLISNLSAWGEKQRERERDVGRNVKIDTRFHLSPASIVLKRRSEEMGVVTC